MNERVLFVDLDGTLLDVSERYWQIHAELVRSQGGEPVPRDLYWNQKRSRITDDSLFAQAGLDGRRVSHLASIRLSLLEDPRFLRFDVPVAGAREALEELASFCAPVLVTLRRDRAALVDQLDRLGLADRFARVILRGGTVHATKGDLIAAADLNWLQAAIVGDTEEDIAAGRQLGIHAIAVTTGLRTEGHLSALAPSAVVTSIVDVPSVVRRLDWSAIPRAASPPCRAS